MAEPKTISIVDPCYNEEETRPLLAGVLEQLIAMLERSYQVEVLFVDDGSSDGTQRVLSSMAPRLRGTVLTHHVNRGIADAFRTGFAAARGDIVCTIDADCTFDPLELPLLIDELETTGADIVTASPYHPDGGVEGVPAWRLVLSRGASAIYGRLAPVRLFSYTACLRVFRRSAVAVLTFRDPGFLGVTQMLISALTQGLKVVEHPMVLKRRVIGVSKMRTLQVIRDHLRYMASLSRRSAT